MINLADKPFDIGSMVIRLLNGFTVGYPEVVTEMYHTPNESFWTFRTKEDTMWRSSLDWKKVKPLYTQPHD